VEGDFYLKENLMLNQSCDDKFMEILERIDPKLKFYARHLSWTSKTEEADDLYQQMLLKLLERSRIDPEFLNQNSSYILCYATWMAKNFIKHEKSLYYRKITEDDSLEFVDPEFQLHLNHPRKPETEAENQEIHDLAGSMPYSYRNLFKQIVAGFQWQEIAQKMRITRDSFFWKRERMIKTLHYAWSSPWGRKNEIVQSLEIPTH
jgi:RNA polymerase sigma factor (sigma-70 family)